MDSVLLKCAHCDAKLGSLVNLWTQIGKKYMIPAVFPEEARRALKVKASGGIRAGDPATLIAGCELQEAACEKCQANIGQECLNCPPNHALSDGQIIFRTSSIVLKSGSDNRRGAEPKIQRVLKLRREPFAAAAAAAAAAKPRQGEAKSGVDPQNGTSNMQGLQIIQIQAEMEAQRQEIQRIGSTGYQVMTSFETAMQGFESEIKRLHHSVDTVRSDGETSRKDLTSLKAEVSESQWNNAHNSTISRLDAQLQTTDSIVTELQQAARNAKSESAILRDELAKVHQELGQVKEENAGLKCDIQEAKEAAKEGIATSKLYATELSSLKREIKQLRSELANEQMRSPAADEGSMFSSHQLDILASNISKIGNRASQIESLQMEFELFRTRVQRLEVKASNTPRNDGRPSMADTSFQREQGSQSHYSRDTRNKRSAAGEADPLAFDSSPSKRMALSSDYPKITSTGYVSADEEQLSSPLGFRVNNRPQLYSQTKALSGDSAKTRRTMRSKK